VYNFFFGKLKRGIQERLYVKENNGSYAKKVLKRKIKQKIAVGLGFVPARKADHPRRNVQTAQK
jgi:hypothetical protein